jgi:hypothetical protein
VPRTSSSGENTTAKPRARTTRSTRQPDSVTDRQPKSGNGGATNKTGNGASAAAASEMPYSPSYDEIAEAAYQRYLQRGGQDGQDFDDWLEAERQLKQRRS